MRHMFARRVVTCCISSRVNLVLGLECTSFMIWFLYLSQKMRYAVRARLGFSPWPSTRMVWFFAFLPFLWWRFREPAGNLAFSASYWPLRMSASALHSLSSFGLMFFHSSASFVVTACISSRVNLALGWGCTARMICSRYLSQNTR